MSSSSPSTDLPLPRGLMVELFLPRLGRNDIDWAALGSLIDRVSPLADSLVVAGPDIGGGLGLSEEQRLELLTFTAQRTELPLLILVTTAKQKSTLALAEAIGRLTIGPRLWLLDAALYHHSNRGLPDWINRLEQAADRPVVLYNHPKLMDGTAGQAKRRNIRTAVLKKAAEESPGLAGVVFRGQPKRLVNYIQALKAGRGLRLYDANEVRFLIQPAAAGALSWGANLIPDSWALVTRSVLNLDDTVRPAQLLKQAKRARRLARRLLVRPLPWLEAGLIRQGVMTPPEIPTDPGVDPGRADRFFKRLPLIT